jgi:hypothetical protein
MRWNACASRPIAHAEVRVAALVKRVNSNCQQVITPFTLLAV